MMAGFTRVPWYFYSEFGESGCLRTDFILALARFSFFFFISFRPVIIII